MKRVVTIAVIMVMVTSLFAFPVFAANPSVFNDYSASISSNGVQFLLRAVQFKSSSLGTSMLPGGMESVFYVTLEIRNSNTQAALVRNPQFNITISEDKTISHIYSYSSDLLLERQTWFKVVPSSEFSYASNGSELIVVPPETSLYFVGEICTTAQLDQTGQTIEDAGLRGVDFVENDFYIAKGDYPYGTAVDLSPVTNLLSNLDSNIDDIDSAIHDLIDVCTYTGTTYQYSPTNAIYSTLSTNPFSGVSRTGFNCIRVVGKSYLINEVVNYDSGNDTYTYDQTVRTPFYIFIKLQNRNQQTLFAQYYHRIDGLFPNINNINGSIHISTFYSDLYKEIYVTSTYTELHLKHTYNTTNQLYGVVPIGDGLTVIRGYIDMPKGTNLSWPTMTNNNFTGSVTPVLLDEYYPVDEYTLLRDLYLSLVEKSVDDNTEEAQDMNDEIHEKEQVWYDNNSDALEAVGLSNYRFSTSQSSGITQAVTQFQAVWNALGDWTNVYIFILILSISTYIIRHEPTTRVKQYRSSVQAERAERISYYGKKNAEARASSSGSTFKAALRRRK